MFKDFFFFLSVCMQFSDIVSCMYTRNIFSLHVLYLTIVKSTHSQCMIHLRSLVLIEGSIDLCYGIGWKPLSLIMHLLLLISFIFELTDGLSICWEGYLYCCMGGVSFIVHGIVGLFYPEVANCWGSWNSVAHPCWA